MLLLSLLVLIYVTILIILMLFWKQARGATNMVLSGDLVLAGTLLVTPATNHLSDRSLTILVDKMIKTKYLVSSSD